MKNFAKVLLLLVGVITTSTLFAQRGRYGRRDDERSERRDYSYRRDYDYRRDYHDYSYNSRPYYYPYGYGPSVSIIARLPFGAIGLTLGGRNYHYYDGIYYEYGPRGYVIVEPPMGIIVPMLPPGSTTIIIGGRPYYRWQDIYYLQGNNGYQVVPEPRVETEQAPVKNNNNYTPGNEYEKFQLDGKTYYKKGNKYYRAKVSESGEVVYEEAGETSK